MTRKTLVLFYSRTGTTRTLAAALGERLGAEQAEIGCPRYRRGWARYLLAGYDSVSGNLPQIDMPAGFGDGCAAYDLVLLGGPVWTSHPALPLRSFLAGTPSLPPRVGLFLTYGGHCSPARAMDEFATLLPHAAAATLSLTSAETASDRRSGPIDRFVTRLVAPRPMPSADSNRAP